MNHMSRDRFSAWRDLDALVAAELDALQRRRIDSPQPDAGAETFKDSDSIDGPFDEMDEQDEEAFIERTAAWLRNRPDADALLGAIRAALDDVAEMPDEPATPDPVAEAPAAPAEKDGAA
jgi:hypothetical protein